MQLTQVHRNLWPIRGTMVVQLCDSQLWNLHIFRLSVQRKQFWHLYCLSDFLQRRYWWQTDKNLLRKLREKSQWWNLLFKLNQNAFRAKRPRILVEFLLFVGDHRQHQVAQLITNAILMVSAMAAVPRKVIFKQVWQAGWVKNVIFGRRNYSIILVPFISQKYLISAYTCTVSFDVGTSCGPTVSRWYYSSATRTCQNFAYLGCDGGPNNFATQQDCQDFCGAGG